MSHSYPTDPSKVNFVSPGGDDAIPKPRRPKPETEARLLNGSNTASKASPVKSTLSASAPEFIPRNCHTAASQYQEMSYNTYSDPAVILSPGAPEFVPRGGHDTGVMEPLQESFVDSVGQMNLGLDDLTNYLLSEFHNTMMILISQPGNMTEYLRPLCDKLQQANSEDILHAVIDILYNQSIFEPNFRYTGSRVCHFLCKNLKEHPIFKHFKQAFLNRCQKDYSEREQLLKNGQEGLERLCGLTLFMGELFLNVTVGNSCGHTERLEFLPPVLTDLLLTLLSQPSDLNVKTACQLLKLSGGPVEDSMLKKANESENWSRVFHTLDALQSSSQITPNMQALVKSVLNLRQNNWGRPEPNPGILSQSTEQTSNCVLKTPDFVQAEPVFYNAYGKPITREEAGYAEEDVDEEEEYVLNDEEEEEFLAWQAESGNYPPPSNNSYISQMPPQHQGGPHPNPANNQNHRYQQPPNIYQQWSTSDNHYNYMYYYSDDYSGDGYPVDEGLTMDEEAEAAYDEFLSSQPSYHNQQK